ncbi:FAD-dependent oxidoreductase [Paractinoplanes rishiriensis]|uniref:FAD-dependent oxidoreductase n=1 Tax=Paractinoplanes rishiriensis TaxID=1050105 RepID=A0A919MVB0_9ACTN|nr:FAD-dependent oxidoreductase [Actinoplanes rishiriensis]GIE96234.1 FAD-dependent oxidoreductase [Actinoplanes rishiriensis]
MRRAIRTAAIIGGGIGGLAAAIGLRRAGWRVTVFERQEAIPATGTALGIWPAALQALDTLGVGAAVRERAEPQQAGEFRRPDGSRIASIDVERLERRTGDRVFLLSRPGLLGLLHSAASDCDLRFGTPVGSVVPLRAEFDLVVAADGVFSRVREEVFGVRARYAGSTAWRGYLDNLPTGTFTEVWGAGAKFGVTPMEGGRTNWYASAGAPEGQFHPGAELGVLRGMFGTWPAPVATVLAALTEQRILRHDIYVTPHLPSYVSGNVVLLGDAAHAMTPDLGRGACEAVIDAVTLTNCLIKDQNLMAYDAKRRRTTQRLARMAGAAAWLTHVRRGVPVRDALLKASLRAGPPA